MLPREKIIQGDTMRWTDTRAIAIALEEEHPQADNVNLRFTDLRDWVLALPGFAGDAHGCNEKILEAIQMAWLDERD
jgi:FeS assembly protein IscX